MFMTFALLLHQCASMCVCVLMRRELAILTFQLVELKGLNDGCILLAREIYVVHAASLSQFVGTQYETESSSMLLIPHMLFLTVT